MSPLQILLYTIGLILLISDFSVAKNVNHQSVLYEKAYALVREPESRENWQRLVTTYHAILKSGPDLTAQIGLAYAQGQLANSGPERNLALQIEKEAIEQFLFSCDLPLSIKASQARMVSELYRGGIFIPKQLEKAQHWAHVAQSFEESSLYRCPDRQSHQCWRAKRPAGYKRLLAQRVKAEIERHMLRRDSTAHVLDATQ